ncbi:MAG: ankyrin repeat domain-containing protein [Clostridia bacterium]|nr:ankyrin repeat domain-containing protein [Clostridia bacterium]
MQKTFKILRQGDIKTLKEILDKNPNEINAIAKQPPKKDDGQSLLQVAFKTGQYEIANLLLDYNADVNFMESEENCCNRWRAPVLHDSIRCAMFSSRTNYKKWGTTEYETKSNKADADSSYNLLKRMLELGADINAKDSCGNTTLERAILDAKQLLPRYDSSTGEIGDDRLITDELRFDFSRVFKLLYEYGADNNWVDRYTGKTLIEEYKCHPVSEFLNLGD